MATYPSDAFTAQLAYLGPKGQTVLLARCSYTTTGFETDGDVIEIATMPAGATLIPAMSLMQVQATFANSAQYMIGTVADPDACDLRAPVGLAGRYRWLPTAYALAFQEPTVIRLVWTSTGTGNLNPGVRLEFCIAWVAGA